MTDICPKCNADVDGERVIDGYYFQCECGYGYLSTWEELDKARFDSEAFDRRKDERNGR